MQSYNDLNPYFGDLHNHCSVGYGHGNLADSFRNARMQLDFVTVTVHAHWPDIPEDDARLTELVAYHRRGFERTAEAWPQVRQAVAQHNVPGEFITFLGFEWHSRQFGDHNIYFKGNEGDILRAADLEELRAMLRGYREKGIDAMALPHHIGYRQGYRGINWAAFTPEFSPVVEIMSMHGASDSAEAPYPYLHTMGPRDYGSMVHRGLEQGHIFGVIGSTDHHSAHPGSYGHGRLGVWSPSLSRDAIWDAIQNRQTYALTGDNISLAFAVNSSVMGSVLPASRLRQIEYEVVGGDAIDYVEVVHNNRVIHRSSPGIDSAAQHADPFTGPVKLHMEVGWANKGVNVDWEVDLAVRNGGLLDVEPRFRGHDVVAPQATEEETYVFSDWSHSGSNRVSFKTRTWGNPATTTTATQGLALTLDANPGTVISANINGKQVDQPLSELLKGPRSDYLGGFLTPAYTFHRVATQAEYACRGVFEHECTSSSRDWYYVRVRQYNGQWAWSSAIWVDGE